jgi:hypothetical protein
MMIIATGTTQSITKDKAVFNNNATTKHPKALTALA